MTTWRPTHGDIYSLDEALFNFEILQEFLANQRIIALVEEREPNHMVIELAVTGRRRKVAVLDDSGSVLPGPPLAEVVDAMDSTFRKTQMSIGGEVRYGDIDLGEVDIDADADAAVLQTVADEEPSSEEAPEPSPGEAPEPATEHDAEDDETPDMLADLTEIEDLPRAPVLIISDIAMSEFPALAASTKSVLAVLPHHTPRVIVAENGVDVRKKLFPRPTFLITLTAATGEAPTLTVYQDNHRRLKWTWDAQSPIASWMEPVPEAIVFATEHMGAGAVARRCVEDVESANAVDVRRALLASPAYGPTRFIQAMGLPLEVSDALYGRKDVRTLTGAQVFEHGSFRDTLRNVVALEVSGHGVARPRVWEVYRKLYLDRPGATNAIASIQAAIGGSIFVGSLKSSGGRAARIGAGIGALLIVNAISRVLTTQWIVEAIEDPESASRLEALQKKNEQPED